MLEENPLSMQSENLRHSLVFINLAMLNRCDVSVPPYQRNQVSALLLDSLEISWKAFRHTNDSSIANFKLSSGTYLSKSVLKHVLSREEQQKGKRWGKSPRESVTANCHPQVVGWTWGIHMILEWRGGASYLLPLELAQYFRSWKKSCTHNVHVPSTRGCSTHDQTGMHLFAKKPGDTPVCEHGRNWSSKAYLRHI